jgi:quercetin dioxygenase-like cupin family protein
MAVQLDEQRLVLLRAGEGEVITDVPERTLRLLTDDDRLTLTWFRYEPGEEGPDPHVHYTHSDAFYVLDGELELRLGPDVQSVAAPPGTLGSAPANLVHTFKNSSDATALFINVHAPGAGFADMLRARRDGRHREAEQFDQHEPPEDGGRPLGDAVVGTPDETGLQDRDGHFSLARIELGAGTETPLQGLTAVYVLDGAATLGETELGTGDFALVDGEDVLCNASDAATRCAIFSV